MTLDLEASGTPIAAGACGAGDIPRLCGARYALHGEALPAVTEAVAIGDWARRAALSQYGRLTGGGRSAALSGRQEGGLLQGHRHAFYLAGDVDGDGRLDRLVVYAPMGFDAREHAALLHLRRLWAGGARSDLHLTLLGLFTWYGLQESDPWSRPAAVWESATPYVLTRYPKQHRDGRPKLNAAGQQIDGPADQVRREWATRRLQAPDLPELRSVEPVDACHLSVGRSVPWHEFQRWRPSGGGASASFYCGLRLTFAAPVAGPLALGYGCHYGLGQFRPSPVRPPAARRLPPA